MNCHLVAVEVRVVCGTGKRMQLQCSALYQYGFKSLNTESVKRRCAVEHDRVILYDDFKGVPNLRARSFHHFSCVFDVGGCADINKALHNKGFEKLQSHFFRKAALTHLELRAYNDN